MTQADLRSDVVTLESMRADAGFSHVQDALDRAIAIVRTLASMSDAAVDAMLTQMSNLATSWAGARDAALTDAEHERCDVIACGYAALAAVLRGVR